MRIVIDMQGAQTESRFRGIGRYSLSFAQAIARNHGEHEIFLILNGLFHETIEPIRIAFTGLLPQANILTWWAPGPVSADNPKNDGRRQAAELIREAFIASLRPDIVHLSSLFEGYIDDAVTSIGQFSSTTATSVSFYDLIPLLNPDQYLKPRPQYASYYQRKITHLKQAGALLAISDFAREEALSHLETPAERVTNVSTAIEADFRPLSIDDGSADHLKQRLGLSRPFLLYTGGSDERKNLPRLLQAYAALPAEQRTTHQLLLAGKMSEGCVANLQREAAQAGLQPGELCFSGYVTDVELIQLYNLCKLFVFPSWHEGFGLPALEAMACGAAVIGAGTTSLPEVIGLPSALFDPTDTNAITATMSRALGDASFTAELRQHGLQQAKRFSWDETARRAFQAWHALHTSKHVTASPATQKPRLAFVSPLPPERSGIADYSEQLLPALAQHYSIEVIVCPDEMGKQAPSTSYNVRDMDWLRAHSHEMDRVIYQMGNSPFHKHMLKLLRDIPGTVVLHDFYLSGLLAWLEDTAGAGRAWTEALFESHGYLAVRERFLNPQAAKYEYPANIDILRYAQGVIVHSEYSRKLAEHWYAGRLPEACEVIPLLRCPAESIDRTMARRHLNIAPDSFVICSFGFLDPTKLNHRLLQAWIASKLSEDKRCTLIFVGENHSGDYGFQLLETIRSYGLEDRVRITGFAAPELFQHYLAAADMAVQLRTRSRGETSAAVLDCMNHALPVITNANGSMAELDPAAVWMLPDEYQDCALVEALETLWQAADRRSAIGQRAQQIIAEHHSPAECALRYKDAIERFHLNTTPTAPGLADAIAATCGSSLTDTDLLQLATAIDTSLPLPRSAKRLYLDITATCSNGLNTGIERVARALLLALLESPPAGYRIEPVYLSETGGNWHYRHASHYTLQLLGCPSSALNEEKVSPYSGDIVLGLDVSGTVLTQAQRSGLFSRLRAQGVRTFFMVHDLLPVRMPEVFPDGATQGFTEWLQSTAQLDGIIGVTRQVADDYAAWMKEQPASQSKRQKSFYIGWSHHGADLGNSAPSGGLPDDAARTLEKLRTCPSFLLVGTIEPRKGHLQVLQAFSALWQQGVEANLVIVGKEGWKGLPDAVRRNIPETVKALREHPERGKRLVWLENASDEYLEKLYANSACLIAASFGEGFGLPLIEAAQHRLPIFARDIPVFREVAGEHAYYFQHGDPARLAASLKDWIALYQENKHPRSDAMPWLTWAASAQRLQQQLLAATAEDTEAFKAQ
ncbi:glycosyltransferase [Stutzerimonas kunmingensis]|uniref:glycosyltransferase n=1 Tax=Stutzerimonas kunmingensis TaxID=1211807 RepID=UPI0026ED7CCA|nr:glycosyltransferase [Stutzerimonas kunmingensis]